MIKSKHLVLGPSEAGKTELGRRVEKLEGRSDKSTKFINTFIHTADNFFKKDEGEELYISGKLVKIRIIDIAGQQMKVKQYVRHLLDLTGITYVFESPKPIKGLNELCKIDDEITKEYIELEEKKPQISTYMSKSEVESTTLSTNELFEPYKIISINKKPIKIEEIIKPNDFTEKTIPNIEEYQKALREILDDKEPDYVLRTEDYSITDDLVNRFESVEYTTLGHALKFCKERNSSLFIGDSIGSVEKYIDPIAYLVRTPDRLLLEPVEVNIHSIFTICLVYPKTKDRITKKALEPTLIDDCINYGVISH
jgi:hypothetical protein